MVQRMVVFATLTAAALAVALLAGRGTGGEADAEEAGRGVAFDLLLSIHERDRAGFHELFDAEATTEAEREALFEYYVAIETFREAFFARYGGNAWPVLSDLGPVSGTAPARLPDLHLAVSDAAEMPVHSTSGDVSTVELPALRLALQIEQVAHGEWAVTLAKGPAPAGILARDAEAIDQHLHRIELLAARNPAHRFVRDPEAVLRELRWQLRSLPYSRVNLL